MIAAVEFVRRHPGCAKLPVAEHVGPNCSRRYGYQSVDRAIRAGLIRAEKGNGIAYKLYVAE
jgi:hypothetical protein